tara:strand:- start:259 stop:465 length:207 start_codon:yes stop_codon:yes gene_type:complete
MKSPEAIAEQVIRDGECGSDEIVWTSVWSEPRIGAALIDLKNKGLVQSVTVGTKLTAKGIQLRLQARS